MSCGTLIALASTAAGTGMTMAANAEATDQMNKVTNEQVNRQNEFLKKSRSIVEQNVQANAPTTFQNNLQQGKQQYMDASKSAQAAPLALAAPVAGGNTADQQARQQMGNQVNADYMGYSRPALETNLGNVMSGARLNTLNNQAQGWANILPLQLQDARNSQQGLSSAGGLVSSFGRLAGSAVNSGMFASSPAWNGFNMSAPVQTNQLWADPAMMSDDERFVFGFNN